jgi:hypothetical protein
MGWLDKYVLILNWYNDLDAIYDQGMANTGPATFMQPDFLQKAWDICLPYIRYEKRLAGCDSHKLFKLKVIQPVRNDGVILICAIIQMLTSACGSVQQLTPEYGRLLRSRFVFEVLSGKIYFPDNESENSVGDLRANYRWTRKPSKEETAALTRSVTDHCAHPRESGDTPGGIERYEQARLSELLRQLGEESKCNRAT